VCHFTVCELPTNNVTALAEFLRVGPHLHDLVTPKE
jgi:hypothetical protein